jgi:predicted metal-dependent enzyme (double-stranded beta helix superfamily)
MSWFHANADGVLIERRQVLRLSAGAAAALLLGLPSMSWAAEAGSQAAEGEQDLSWDDAQKLLEPLAKKLIAAKTPNESAYLFEQSSILARLKKAPDAQFGAQPVAMAETLKALPLYIVQFKLAPGAKLPFHDHRDYNGVLRCIDGEARVLSFDIVGDDKRPPKGKQFQIKQNGDVLLTPGRSSMLSRDRDNVHHVVAGKNGARLLDVFTFFQENAHSEFMRVEEKPADAEQRIYNAVWA